MGHSGHSSSRGFTLLEIVVVLILLTLLAAYAAPRFSNTGDTTITFQADQFAQNLRHTKALAANWGLPLQINISGATYSVVCQKVAGPCIDTVNPVVDPVTGQSFQVSLQDSVIFSASPGTPLVFNYLGAPETGGSLATTTQTYQLASGTQTRTVRVFPVGGLVTETAP
jgi:prepilin-type N-terminal cleavage/methylation domain-containing protein